MTRKCTAAGVSFSAPAKNPFTTNSRPGQSLAPARQRYLPSTVYRLQPDRHRLDFEELLDAHAAVLAAETALLVAAERDLRGGRQRVVDADDAVLQPLGDAEGATDVAGEEVRRQTERRVVRHGDGLFLGVERDDRQRRAERLVVQNLRLRRDVGQDGRLVEVALQPAIEIGGLAPGQHLRAARD